ncbi:hypothetical protein Rsub_08083 [Raphidocelis subcapitata]|uniref:AB hydrolase-1 domain-containing protein n=1 Tax=Raphidocelis subcapitata TaxID=307507 RepID=A0A2V0PDI9_9CHLO|nr:hypothetical protein Rsub_08083 [Raphidocelis subcapitata]|eukprot:GBF95960.1 hypothetical protein Rsub_08083 [Raphidocelis subcapitata]
MQVASRPSAAAPRLSGRPAAAASPSAAPGRARRCVARRSAADGPGGAPPPAASPFGAPPPQRQPQPRDAASPQQQGRPRPWSLHSWSWRGHRVNYATAGCGRPVVLVHGFGASLGHYRATIPALAAAGYKVYALDLLGFGASDKPVLQEGYSIELWAQLLADFAREFPLADGGGGGGSPAGSGAVFVGNSVGSLVCLAAAAELPADAVAGVCLLNSAGAMNNKGVVADWRIIAALPLLWLIDLLLSIRPIARALFDNVRDRATLAKVLRGVYRNEAAVDDDLVDIIAGPSNDETALDVFVSVITGPAGPKPWDLLPRIAAPIFIAWGDRDPFTPLDGPVGKFFADLPEGRAGTRFALLPDVGHCPQDDRPELLHAELLPWLAALPAGGPACGVAAAAAGGAADG